MKKVLALTLVLVLAISMSTVAFAAPNQATKIDYKLWDYDTNFGTPTGLELVDGKANKTAIIPILGTGLDLDPALLQATATTGVLKNAIIGKSVFTKSDMGVKLRWSKGSQILDEAKLNKDKSQIEITFKTNVASIKDIPYKFEVLVTFGGRTIAGGTTSNGDAPVYEGTWERNLEDIGDADWFDFDGSSTMKTDTFIRAFEYGFDGFATGHGRALKGVEYWADGSDSVNDADQDIMIKYSAVVGVIHLNQINVKNVLDYVTLDNADASMYIYDGDMNYLGKGNEKLAYADTYYLAAAQLDVDSGDEPIEEDDDEDDDWDEPTGYNPNGGGDDLYPENPHDNPGTGK